MRESPISYGPMSEGEEDEVFSLVSRVFDTHVARFYSPSGIKKFRSMLSPAWLSEKAKGQSSFVTVARKGESLVGMIAVIESDHIALLFVEAKWQGGGIGMHLLECATDEVQRRNPDSNALTVSSSPNSLAFYKKAGFSATGSEVNEGGMRFTPMKKALAH